MMGGCGLHGRGQTARAAHREAQEEAGLADARVADQHENEQVVICGQICAQCRLPKAPPCTRESHGLGRLSERGGGRARCIALHARNGHVRRRRGAARRSQSAFIRALCALFLMQRRKVEKYLVLAASALQAAGARKA